MIVPMKKISIIVETKDIATSLNALRKAGLLHIEHQNSPIGETVTMLEERYSALSKAIDSLPDTDIKLETDSSLNPEELVSLILSLVDEKTLIAENLKRIRKDIEIWKEWGDFDPELIDDLKDNNIWIQLLKISKKKIGNVPEGVVVEQLFKKGDILYCVAISTEEIDMSFEKISLPDRSLEEMIRDERIKDDRSKAIGKRLIGLAGNRGNLLSYRTRLVGLIEFNRVDEGMAKLGRLSYLKGYCPIYSVKHLEDLSKQEKWALLVETPDKKDIVPTLIKNNKLVEIIRPVFQMIKTIPGYRELDISLWFLLFFSVFFGMLIGDAGYGLIFLLVNFILHMKLRSRIKDRMVFSLIYVLSFCAIVWGVLSGTFFGQAYLPKSVQPLLPYLRDNTALQALCFFIGALHLSIAHIWRLIRKLPSLKAFSEIGWIAVLWSAYFLAKSLILGDVFPVFGKWFLIGGAGSIILFSNPKRNVIKGIGSGVGEFLLNIVNSFTDVVSYIRLFAVGAATIAVADAFNQMAFSIGYGSIIKGFLIAVVLLSGHTLNILLGTMAILVHGIRLNVLEFSSHLNMEWSGVEWMPFREGRE